MNKLVSIKTVAVFDMPMRVVEPYSWIEHIPFAFFLVDIVKPKLFVELGVHTGNSFNAFCQAVKTLCINTACYGVDTWQGDEHVGFYNGFTYNELFDYQQKNYGEVAHMLKMTFEAALEHFSDCSIDILHIDGFHTYEAVKHDFENWLPKMSEKGVIVLHDTSVREKDFGVWKLWEEISREYPSFEFKHGYGLGIVAVGKNAESQVLEFIKEANENIFFQKFFYILGSRIKTQISEELIKQQSDLIAQKDQQIMHRDMLIAERDEQLREITGSLAWWMVTKIRRFLPFGAKCGIFYRKVKNALKIIKNEGFGTFWKRLRQKISSRLIRPIGESNKGEDDSIFKNRTKSFKRSVRPTKNKILEKSPPSKTDREELGRILQNIKRELLHSQGLNGDTN